MCFVLCQMQQHSEAGHTTSVQHKSPVCISLWLQQLVVTHRDHSPTLKPSHFSREHLPYLDNLLNQILYLEVWHNPNRFSTKASVSVRGCTHHVSLVTEWIRKAGLLATGETTAAAVCRTLEGSSLSRLLSLLMKPHITGVPQQPGKHAADTWVFTLRLRNQLILSVTLEMDMQWFLLLQSPHLVNHRFLY